MRLLIAECQVDYTGRLTAHLPMAQRLILVKADGSVSVHADDRAYKPLNWMNPPCTITVAPASSDGLSEIWDVRNRQGDTLQISIGRVLHDSSHELGTDPGLVKDGVESHLQVLLADNPGTFGPGWTLVQREFATALGPVDLLFRDQTGQYVAVEVKRRGEIDGVEQLTRYLDWLNSHPHLHPVRGVFAAQHIKPQARILAAARGIGCLLVDYDALRGLDNADDRLF